MVDIRTPDSPDWWLVRLGKQLDKSCRRYDLLERYYSGNHPLPEGDRRARELFRLLQKKARTNYCELVVDAPRERLKVVGFRTGGDGTEQTDREAWKIWQANKMDANAGLVHTAALKFGISYVIVGPNQKRHDRPIITPEDPREVTHASDPLDWRKVRAAIKTWHDDVSQKFYAVVYLPGTIHYYRSVKNYSSPDQPETNKWTAGWWEIDTSEEFPDGTANNPLGDEVPVVPFVNRPDLKGNGQGEFEGVLDIQDRINNQILDRLVIAKMQAYRQRWATGVDTTDEKGRQTEPFVPGADLLWSVPNDDAKFGDFAQADITPLLAAVRDDVQDMASISKTPPHYLLSSIINASGDALKAAETGLVSKVLDDQVEFGESWETVNRLAGRYTGRDVPEDAEVVWKDPESRTLAELASANTQLKAADVPWRPRMRLLGFSPSEIDRMEAERTADAMLNGLFGQQEAAGQPPSTPGANNAPAEASSNGVRPSDQLQRAG